MKAAPTPRRYQAFISYSHAGDRSAARLLQRTLERFGSTFRWRRRMTVFRDDTNLAASPDLWSSVESALDRSEYLILLASPGSAASEWVDREVKHFLTRNPLSRFGLVLVAGTSRWTDEDTTPETDAISQTVRTIFEEAGTEPLVVDLRSLLANSWRRHRDEFLGRVATIVAAVLRTDKDQVFGEHIRAQRRAILGLAGGLVLITGLAVLSFMQFRLANRRLTQAVGVARHIHEVLDERLAMVAGAASIRRDLLEASGQLLNELIGETPGSRSDVRLQRLVAHVRRGFLAFDTEALDASAREFDSAIDLARRFPQRAQQEWAWTRQVARARVGRGDVFEATGDLAHAFEEFEAARASLLAFAGGEADLMMLRRQLSVALDRLHSVEKARGNDYQAAERLREALALDEALVGQWPDDVVLRSNLAVTYTHLADLDVKRNELAAAAGRYGQAEAILDRLMLENPANATLQDSWVDAVVGLGIAELYQGRRDRATAHFERAQARVALLAEREPTQVYWQRLLAATVANIGAMYAAVGARAEAEAQYQRSIWLLDGLLRRDGTNALLIHQRANLDTNLGDLAWDQSDYAKALPHYERANERFAGLQQRDPDNSDWALSRATALERLGNLWLGRGDAARAEEFYASAQSLAESYVRKYPDSWDWRFARAGFLVKLAEVAETRKDPDATGRFATAVRALESLQLGDSQNLVALSVLGFALNGLGQTLIDAKSLDDALVQLRRAESIHADLLSRDAKNMAWGTQFVESVSRISQIETERERYDEAERALARCVKAAQQLVTSHPGTVPALVAASTCQSRVALLAAWRGEDSSWLAATTELTIQRAQIAALAPEDAAREEELRVVREVLLENLRKGSAADREASKRRLRSAAVAIQETLPDAAAALRSLAREVARG